MAAELFSTSLPHSDEVEALEAKKSLIHVSNPEPTAEHDGECDGVQPNNNKDGRAEEEDSWQAAHPTLRERYTTTRQPGEGCSTQ